MSTRETVTFFACSILSCAAMVYLVRVVYGALQRAHGLQGWPARTALALGLGGVFGIMYLIGLPLQKLVYTAFN